LGSGATGPSEATSRPVDPLAYRPRGRPLLRDHRPGVVWATPGRDHRCTRYGAPGVTRTPGTQFRKLLLYPPELRGRANQSANSAICEAPRDSAITFPPGVVDSVVEFWAIRSTASALWVGDRCA